MITREMFISEIINGCPQTIPVLRSFGLKCQGCQIADYEDIEHGAGVHDVDINKLLKALNKVADSAE